MSKKLFKAKGKLLLFGEYAVLDGALSLAVPTRFGQSLEIKPHRGSDLIWESYDHNGDLWFESQISLYDFSPVRTSDEKVSKYVQKLLKGAVRYNTEFLNKWNGFKAINHLDFNPEWGLGSSSTLIYNVAQWAGINPFHLHFYVSNGSGYDIACADAEGPLTYQLNGEELSFTDINFAPHFFESVYFVYLGQKVRSGESIRHYAKTTKRRNALAKKVTVLTERAIKAVALEDFMAVMDEHEALISESLDLPEVKKERFSDFEGSIKSLGAWGGDFAMVATDLPQDYVESYFADRGCPVIMPYHEMAYSADAMIPVT